MGVVFRTMNQSMLNQPNQIRRQYENFWSQIKQLVGSLTGHAVRIIIRSSTDAPLVSDHRVPLVVIGLFLASSRWPPIQE